MLLFLVVGFFISDSQRRLELANQRTEMALAQTREANEHINQLYQKTLELDELKTHFFANVSHELRTPLTLILGPIEKCLASGTLDADGHHNLELAERNAHLLHRLISDLLDVAKLEAKRMDMHYAQLDLARLVRVTASNFESVADDRQIRYAVHAPEAMPAQLDADKIQRILLNLLSNAFKFVPNGGEISVRLTADDGQARLEVVDNGPGIPAGMRDTVFERFRQVEEHAARRHGGTGLGLAMVKEYAELHGGSADVAKTPGGGATFVVRLPVAAPEGAVVSPGDEKLDSELGRQVVSELRQERGVEPLSAPGVNHDGPLIMVVEDNPDMNAYVADALKRQYRVATAFDGVEGLSRAIALRPELIITDIMMPNMSGDRMVEEIRRHPELAEIPIVALTAKADDGLRLEMIKGGVQAYLNKPFSVDELLARIGGLLAERQRTNVMRMELAAIVEASADAIIGKSLDGVITSWNRGAERIFGYTAAEAVGHTMGELFPQSQEEGEREMGERISRGETIDALEGVRIRKDGQTITVSETISPIKDHQGLVVGISLIARDISERKRIEEERAITAEVLRLINDAGDADELLRTVLHCLKRWSGCEAVGIRLREDDDYPYFETSGFDPNFVRLEYSLCARDSKNQIVRDANGEVILDCMCGNIIQGRVDPSKPFFTVGGSFWSNCTSDLLATTTEADRQARTRNRCNGSGYESVALVPMRADGEAFGLIQFNDKHKDFFRPDQIVLLERLASNIAGFLAKKKAEESLRKSEERFRLLFDAASVPLCFVDKSGALVSFNSRFVQTFGYTHEETPTMDDWWRLAYPDPEYRRWVVETWEDAVVRAAGDKADIEPIEYLVTCKNGETRIMVISGCTIGENLLATFFDITQRKRAELALSQSQAAIRGLLDATDDVIVLVDRDFMVQAANAVAARRLGQDDVASIQGRCILEYFPEDVAKIRRAHLEEVLASGQPLRFQDQRLGRRFDNHLYPVTDERGLVTGIAIYARDITQSIEDAQKNSALEKQLQQAQKMEAIGTLAGGIAHDFNNILGVIMGYSEMALDDATHGGANYHDIEQVLQAGERAKSLVKQILTFSRKVEVEMKPLDLNKEIAQAVQLLGKTIPKMIRMDTDLAQDLWVVNANANQLEQIMLNLGVNAADAMPDGGRLTIKTENVAAREDACLTCGGVVSGPHVAISISDTGHGMDSQVIDHIFEPFYTTKGPGKGTGLGLSTVHGIVSGHGGHITCVSAPGEGTTFTILLPAFQEQREHVDIAEHANASTGGCERILLVDDEEALLRLGTRILAQAGYDVLTASTGEQAVSLYQTSEPRPDLLIMDLGMPGMGGKKALDEVLGANPQAKVIVSSGYGANGLVKAAFASGASGFVAKPYRKAELLGAVRSALDGA